MSARVVAIIPSSVDDWRMTGVENVAASYAHDQEKRRQRGEATGPRSAEVIVCHTDAGHPQIVRVTVEDITPTDEESA